MNLYAVVADKVLNIAKAAPIFLLISGLAQIG